jgi:hypothetical protein
MTIPDQRARTFDLPPSVVDHLTPADRNWLWLPPHPLSAHDELNARDQLDAWDALAGRLLRAALFADDARVMRKGAEAVAAVAEDLNVYLDGPRP